MVSRIWSRVRVPSRSGSNGASSAPVASPSKTTRRPPYSSSARCSPCAIRYHGFSRGRRAPLSDPSPSTFQVVCESDGPPHHESAPSARPALRDTGAAERPRAGAAPAGAALLTALGRIQRVANALLGHAQVEQLVIETADHRHLRHRARFSRATKLPRPEAWI